MVYYKDMILYIVRHGQTDWNLEYRMQGRADIELNATGIKEAENLAEQLKDVDFVACYSSPLKRALKTAEIIVGDAPIIIDERLAERGFGDGEGHRGTPEEIFPSVSWKDIFDLRRDLDVHGIEKISSVFARTADFIEDLKKAGYPADAKILIVAHGCVAKTMHYNLVGYNKDTNVLDIFWKNGEIREYEI